MVPSEGGAAVRLVANDPPLCLGVSSPGVKSSWAKWAPEAQKDGPKKYYWLVFSSTRDPGSHGPQLYMTGVVVADGVIESHAAVYLWNQPEQESNHTPAWDALALPPPR